MEGSFTAATKPITIAGAGPGDSMGSLRPHAGDSVWPGPVTLASDLARVGAISNTSLTISGVIDSGANNYGLGIRSANDGGIITLSASNTYKGQTHLVVGNLRLAGGDNRLPITGALTNGNSSEQGYATFDLNGFNQQLAGLASLGATMPLSVTNSSSTLSTLTLSNDATLYSSRGPIGGKIALVEAGTSSHFQVLSGANTYSGDTTISSGNLKLGASNVIPDGVGKGNVILNGSLDLAGFSDTINGLSGSGIVGNSAGTAPVLTVGNNDATSTFNGIMRNFAGALSLVKTGAGTLTLGGSNAYNGATTISTGTLAFGPGGSMNSSSGLTIVPGARLDISAADSFALGASQALTAGRTTGFTTDIQGRLTNNGSILVAGTSQAGTLTINGGLALTGGSLSYDLTGVTTPGSGVNDLIAINGALDLSGMTIINATFLGGSPTVGAYTLITGGTSLSGTAAGNLSLNWPSSSTRLTASLDTTTTVGSVFLQVSGSGSNLVWLGTNGSAWDLNLTTNWDNAGTADRFLNFDSALFNDSSTNGAVDITATIIPAAVVVSNGTLPYTFSTSGAGKISGGASLTKQGTNTLALNLANDYSGPTVITGGILQLGSALALGNTSGSTYATNGGTLDLNSKLLGNEAVTIQGAGADGQGALINSPPSFTANYGLRFLTLAGDATVGGQGRFDVANAPTVLGNGFTLTKVGTNTVNFVDAGNTGFGDINVNAGMFQLQGNSTAGQPANTLTVASGATLGFYVSTVTISKALALNGGSIWVRNSTAALNGPMTLADTNSFQVDGTSLTLFGPIGGTGGFAKAGSGVLNLNNTNSNWAGDSWLSGGAVNVGASSALVGNVSNAVALSFLPGAGATFNCPANIVGSGSLTQPATAPGTTVLSGSNVIDGGITVSAGTLQVANTGSLTGNATVNAATLLVTGGQLNAGTLSVGQNVVNSTNLVTGGGSVSVGHGSTNDLLVGVRSINTGINPRGTLDASGAASLMANVGNLLVGVSTEASTVNPSGGFLFLATNNTITATNIAFGHVLGGGGFNDALTNVVRLGSGSNVFQTPVMIVGGNKMSANFSLPTGGIFVLNDGAAPTDLSVGSTRLLTSGSPGVSADLSGGTFQASLGNLIIGHKDKGPDGSSGSGITRASLTLGSSANNNVTASSVMLGELLDGVGGKSYGTLTVGGGQFFVSNNVTLSSLTGTGTASGTLNLTGGTFSVGGDIVDAGGTSTLLLDGATLDLQPAGRTTNGLIGSVTSPINSFAFRTGTLKNVGEINGGVPFIKDTPGTLILDGVNTFTGPVAVSNGTLFVNGSIGAVPVSVAGGTFGGSGIVDGSVTIHTNGTLAIGPVIEDLLINSDLSLAGTVVMKIDRDHSIGADRITVAYPYILSYGGRLVVTNLGSDLHEGDGFTLFEAFGMLAGAFTEFVLPSLPSGLGWDLSHLSAYGTIYVKVLPGITALTPAEQTLECGVNATFTVTATGPDLAYQWFFGPTPIPWGTGAELIITNVSAANAGTYTVQVSNAAGSTNASGMLLVSDSSPPNITCPADIIVTNTAGGGEIVTFTASAFDNCGPPSVVCAPPSGSSFAVGTTQVQCIATDSATNMGSCLFMVEVRTLLVVTGHVALEAFVGPAHDGNGTRDVVFTATDNATNVLAIWTNTLTFAPGADGYGEAPFALANVPVGTTHLSAKTAWNLRTRLPVTFAGNVATAEFTGADELLGGDIHGANNLVDVDDYFQLAASWYGVDPASDIDGSGLVDVDDYFLLTSHWYTEGDAP